MVFRYLIRGLRNFSRSFKQRRIRWVYFDLVNSLPERPEPPKSFVMRRIFPPQKLTIAYFREMMNRIARVKNIKGVIIHLRDEQEGNARRQSIRKILHDLKAKGKKIIVYAHEYSFLDYYIASVADEIFIQPGGQCFVVGLELTRIFFKDILAKNEIQFEALPISPYKSAMDMFTRSSISDEDQEQYQAILDSYFAVIVDALMNKLGKSQEKIQEIIDNAPYTALQAKKLGLVTDVVNNEELELHVKKIAHTKRGQIYAWQQADRMITLGKLEPRRNKIAIISINGTIIDGESQSFPFRIPIPIFGDEQAGDHTIVNQIRHAIADNSIKAVVLEINSPGGSGAASEAIRAATIELTKTKPLVAYFNDIAASGGYYIATAANKVIAQPTTLTGSIGVLAGKFVLDKGLEKQGINTHYLRVGENAGILSSEKAFSTQERKKLRAMITEFYDLFVDHVSELIGKDREEFEEYCRGRVWSGKDAYELGLVDDLGDLETAIKQAAELANLKEGKYQVVDIFKAENIPPSYLQTKNTKISLNSLLESYMKTKIWLLMPEHIEIR
ncbi:MAG: signal peptide peptidase SppA [Candidatus Heimdallarchaeota archaeon]|nr:signal peptide peptidase SppA [Candidatus Heimdallarchaeota archaeon]